MAERMEIFLHPVAYCWINHTEPHKQLCMCPVSDQNPTNLCFAHVLRDLLYADEVRNNGYEIGNLVSIKDLMFHLHWRFDTPDPNYYDENGDVIENPLGVPNTLHNALLFAKIYGVLLESNYPSTELVLDPNREFQPRPIGPVIMCEDHSWADENDFDHCKRKLEICPLGAALMAYPSFTNWEGEGIYMGAPKAEIEGIALAGLEVDAHSVLVVGHGAEHGTNYFVIKNSWGLKWGCLGYAKVAAAVFRNTGCFLYPIRTFYVHG